MIGTLVHKELLANLLTLRLAVALVFTVLLSVLTTFIGSIEYSARMDAYRTEVKTIREDLGKATVYSQLEPHAVVPPQPLSLFCRGVDKTAGQKVYIYVDWIPAGPSAVGSAGNNLMKTFVEIDFATVVTLLLSFLAVVLGFDGICGERERGTLRQMLVNPVPRGSVIVAKLLGGLLSLWLPLALAFVLSLLVALSNADVVFTGDDWVRLALFFVLSCLFLGQVFSLSLMVSALTRDSATSLIVCLFVWLAGSVGYMNALPSLSRYGVEEAPFQDFLDQNRELWNAFSRDIQTWEEQHPRPADAYFKGIEKEGRLRYAHPQGYAWMQQQNAFSLDKQLERASRTHKLQAANYQHLAREAFLVDRWSILSPFTNYKTLANQLARTTLADKFLLLGAGHRYRETFIQYLRGKDAFASRRWFTDDPVDQEPMIPDPEEVTPEMLAPDSPFIKARMEWARQQEERVENLSQAAGQWYKILAYSLGTEFIAEGGFNWFEDTAWINPGSGRVARGYLLFFLGTTLYLTFFLFLVMGISALARSSASSLVLLVLVWAVFIVIIPQTSYLIGIKFAESPGEWWDEEQEYMDEVRAGLEREGIGLRGRELGKADGYAVEQRYAQRIREAEKEQERIAKRAYGQEVRQYELARMVNLLSPGFAFQYSVEAFLGTGLMRYENFAGQAWQYRDTLRDFIRARDAADADSPHILFFPEYLSGAELDPRNMPRFREKPLPLAESVAAGLGPIVILALEAAGGFFFALWAFNRMDLTG